MPEPGELVTVTRVFGIESIIQSIGGLTSAIEQFQKEVRDGMTNLEEQFNEQADRAQAAIANVAADVQGLKDELTGLTADIQAQVDAGVAARFQSAVDRVTALADQVQGVADSTPDAPPTPPPATP